MTASRYAPDTISSAPTWHKRAVCAQLANPEVMFPGTVEGDIEAARAVCARCPVQRQCLREVITEEGGQRGDTRHGVVAGLTGHERWLVYRTLRRRGQIT